MWWQIVHYLGSMFPSKVCGDSEKNIMDEPHSDECRKKLLMKLRKAKALLQ
jgi:hypothetical protein